MANNFNLKRIKDQNKSKSLSLIQNGDNFFSKKEYNKALENYKRALNFLNKSMLFELAEVYRKIGDIYYLTNEHDLAIDYYEKYVEIHHNNSSAYNILGYLYYFIDNEKSLKYYNKTLELKVNENTLVNKFLSVLKSPHFEQEGIYNAIKSDIDAYREKFIKEDEVYVHNQISDKNKKLNIGYLSSDFYTHAVMQFVLPLLENHNKDKFNIFCYSNTTKCDDVTERVKNLSYKFQDVHNLTNKETATLIFNDQIDILIDLGSHTHTKIFSLMYKPAPVQMTYMGFLNTTGMNEVDYIITDEYTMQENMQQYFTEKPLYLDKGYECFNFSNPNMQLPATDPLPYLKNSYITFGSFNCTSKLNEEVIETWSEILKRVPSSKLLIYRTSLNKLNISTLNNLFKKFDISSERIIYSNEKFGIHFESYKMVDIAFDPFPFNGLTITVELISMGIPSITLSKDCFQCKGAARINKRVGLDDLIADNKDEYINNAVALANNIEKLQEYRNTLRDRLFASSLYNHKDFAESVENAYLKAWNEFCDIKKF